MTKRFCAVVEYTQSRVKISFKLTNLKNKSLIKEYSGEKGSNPHRNKGNFEISLKFDQVRQLIEVRN